jgi:hypothetical protein
MEPTCARLLASHNFPAPDRNDARSALQTTLQRFVLDSFRSEDGALER